MIIGIFAFISGNAYASESVDDYFKKGVELSILEKYEDAIKAFDKTIELDPTRTSIIEYRALIQKFIKDAS